MSRRFLRYEQAHSAQNHDVGVASLAFSMQATFLATAGLDGKVCVWDVDNRRLFRTFVGKTAILAVAWLPNGEDSIVVGYQDGNVTILSMTSNLIDVNGFWAHNFPVEWLAVHNCLIATAAQREVRVWEWHPVDPWKIVVGLADPPKTSQTISMEVLITGIEWTSWQHRDPVLAVSYMNHGVLLYETKSWTVVHTVPLSGPIARTSFSDDGSRIAVSSFGSGFTVYNTLSGGIKCAFPRDAGEKYLTPVLFIHDGAAIVGGTTVGEANIWDVNECQKIQHLPHRKNDRVLTIAAHYIESTGQFVIATGTYGRRTQATVKWWVAGEDPVAPAAMARVGMEVRLFTILVYAIVVVTVLLTLLALAPDTASA